MTRQFHISLLCVLLALSGCDLPGDSAVIDTQIPPTIIEAEIFPSLFDFGKVVTTASTIDVSIQGYVFANDDNGLSDISSVTYSVISPSGKVVTSGTLNDTGVLPDVNAADGKYNSQINLKLPKDIIGIYNVQFSTKDKQGFYSNVINLPLKIIYSLNTAPTISNFICPDTVEVPLNGTNFLQTTVFVNDVEGLVNLSSVYLTIIRSEDSTTVGIYSLFDDGGNSAVPPFGISSGDSLAGDGNYSLVIPVPSNTYRNINRYFYVSAEDQSDAISNTLVKKVYFK